MLDKIVPHHKEAHTCPDCHDKDHDGDDEEDGDGNVQYCSSQRNAQMRIWFCHLVSFWLRLPPVTSRVRVSGMLTRGRECLKVPQSASMILHREATLYANTNIWGKSQTMIVFLLD